MHRELSKKFTSNLSNDHSCKRSAKDVMRLNYIHKKIYVTNCAWVFGALALMVVFGVGGWWFPDGSNPTCDTSNPDKNRTVCGMTEVIQSGASNLEFLSGFIIAGFVSSAVKLWTTRRTAYCALCGATRNLLINVASLVPQEERTLLARWPVLGFELSVLKSRCLIDTEQGRKYLELSNLIFGNEWDEMVDGDRHTSVWYWIQEKATELSERGIIDVYRLQTICNAVTLSRDKANDLMSPIDRDQPPPYVFVCAVLINVNLLLYSMAKGMVWSTWMNDLFDVCALMYNPFGPRDIDIPHGTVGKGIRKLGASLSLGQSLPETMNNTFTDDDHITLLNEFAVEKAEHDLAR